MSSSSFLQASIADVRAGRDIRLRRASLVKWSRMAILLASDLTAFVLAWSLAGLFFASKIAAPLLSPSHPFLWSAVGSSLLVTALRGLYRGGNYWRSGWDLVQAVSLAFLLLVLGWFVLTETALPVGRSALLGAWAMSLAFAGAGRLLVKQGIVALRRRRYFCTPAFVVSSAGQREQIGTVLAKAGYRVVGDACPTRNDIAQLLKKVVASEAQEVVISTLDYLPGLPGFYRGLRAAGITVRWVPSQGELLLRQVGIPRILSGIPTLEVCPPLLGAMDFRAKRLLDIVLSGTALLLLSPLLAAIALAVRLSSPGPALFVQERVGVRGRLFRIYKFRSMYVDAEKRKAELMARNEVQGPLFKIKNDPRVTPVGAFLRKTSLDELPQLWNVLVGDMSLVGPRPPLPSEVAQYEPWHYDRLLVLPGITGMWQISGRSDLQSFDDVVRLDLYYIQNWSLALDIEILIKTVGVVLQGKGAY